MEAATVARAPEGVSDHAMTGAWRVIIARTKDGPYRAWYYHENDDKRWVEMLQRHAEWWVEALQEQGG